MSKLSRLSDQNIEDPILRGEYYRVIFDYLSSKDAETLNYTIKPDESFRPDLAARRAYGNSELAWLITLMGEVDDPYYGLTVGDTLTLPTSAWVRRSMRQFMDEVGL